MIEPHPETDGMTAEELRVAISEADEKMKRSREANNAELETWLVQERRSFEAALARRTGDPPRADGAPHHFDLIDAKSLLAIDEPAVRWIWDGILPAGGMSLTVAKPKVGKTTFGLNLSVAVARGELFLNRATAPGRVIYLALEEKRGEIQKKLQALGVTDEEILFHFGSAPAKAIDEVAPLLESTGAKLLVIDVLQKFIRARDLNDYALVTSALEPIMAAARKFDCHVMLTHHAGKADRSGGDEILGSTALLGGVDTSVNLKKNGNRRMFYTIQRYGEDVPETVVELGNDGTLHAVGSREDVDVEETIPLIVKTLEEGPLTTKEILERIERKTAIVLRALERVVERKQIERTGTGKRGAPYNYDKIRFSVSPHTRGNAGNESGRQTNSKPDNSLFVSQDFDQNAAGLKTRGNELDPWDEVENDVFE